MESTNPDLSAPLSDAARQAVARICAHVAKDLPTASREIVRRIRAEIPDYAVVPPENHRQFVLYHGHMLLAGIAEQSPPRDEQIAHARELGRRRAQQALPIERMPGDYHIAFRKAWKLILRKATADYPEHVGELAHLHCHLDLDPGPDGQRVRGLQRGTPVVPRSPGPRSPTGCSPRSPRRARRVPGHAPPLSHGLTCALSGSALTGSCRETHRLSKQSGWQPMLPHGP